MIEPITGLPAHVLGFSAHGTVSAHDYETVLNPAVEAAFARHEKVRLLYHLGPAFSGFEFGAMVDDARLGLSHMKGWERIALVTDIGWIRMAMRAFAPIMPGEFRVFSNDQMNEARRWISG